MDGADICRVLIADRKANKEITFPRVGLKPRAKAKAKAKAGKGARKGGGRSAALLDGEDGEEEEQEEEADDQGCGMFEEENDDELCFCCGCDSDTEEPLYDHKCDGNCNDPSLCVLDFSYYGQRPSATAVPDTYEDDIDQEMRAYVDGKKKESENDESETMTCMSDWTLSLIHI